MITIVDYGVGNLGSIRNMLKKVGFECQITSDPAAIREASKLVLPGVGAFDAGMRQLQESGLIPALRERVMEHRVPILGICLGMQLLTRRSEEGQLAGLGWVDAEVTRFRFEPDSGLKVPHMGWNLVHPRKESLLLRDAEEEERFYFVHSYYVQCKNRDDVLLTAQYGYEFDAAFACDNIMGVQFHPEKSHKFGMRLLRNFAEVC
jgi:glutamine amidotransferase